MSESRLKTVPFYFNVSSSYPHLMFVKSCQIFNTDEQKQIVIASHLDNDLEVEQDVHVKFE